MGNYKSPELVSVTIKCQGVEVVIPAKDFFEGWSPDEPMLETKVSCPVCKKAHLVIVEMA